MDRTYKPPVLRNGLLLEFVSNHRLRTRRDDDGTTICPGKQGHIFEWGEGRLGVVVMPGKPSVWPRMRARLLAAGFTIAQNGDWEGAATFDPTNRIQAELAIRAAGIKRRRRSSPKQLQNLKKGPLGGRSRAQDAANRRNGLYGSKTADCRELSAGMAL